MPDERWERRFRAPQIGFPAWSAAEPGVLAFLSNEDGSWQAWTLDRATGDRRRVTDEPVGVETVLVAPDGRIVWWQDDVGNEQGRWMGAAPDGSDARPLLAGIPTGWAQGISFAAGAVALAIETDAGHHVYLADDGAPRLLWAAETYIGLGSLTRPGSGGLSADGRSVCVRHAESGDILHQALRVLDADGDVIADLADEGSTLDAVAWSPVPGDQRLAFTSELGPFERPAIWDPVAGERHDLRVHLPGAVIPLGWWPDGSALLAKHEFEGADQLVRVDPITGTSEIVAADAGYIGHAAVRPDGDVWHMTESGADAPRIVSPGEGEVLAPPPPPAPPGRRPTPTWVNGPGGRIQVFVATPGGEGPWPTVLSVHGGPEWHERDLFDPEAQALVDAGYAVALPNYRGSTGYGVAFRRALIGNPWLPETEDVIATLDALVEQGVADPHRVALAGWSWGGCLACLAAGLHPDRFAAVFAGIPSGDFVAAHHACMPELRAYDRALYGGGPDELPEMWAERNPMTYVDRVRAPVLVIAGENDPRCPPEGIVPWIDALHARGVPVEAMFYPEGHHANRTDQQVDHMRAILDFFARYV